MLVARCHDRAALVHNPLINSPWCSCGSRVWTLDIIVRHLSPPGVLELHVLVFTAYNSEQVSVSIQSIGEGYVLMIFMIMYVLVIS